MTLPPLLSPLARELLTLLADKPMRAVDLAERTDTRPLDLQAELARLVRLELVRRTFYSGPMAQARFGVPTRQTEYRLGEDGRRVAERLRANIEPPY